MRKVVFPFLVMVILQIQANAQNQWQKVTSPVSENFTSVCFINATHGWIVSDAGTILSTANGGMTWQVDKHTDYHFESVHFVDSSFGAIVGWHKKSTDSSLILITHNGGGKWSDISHPRATGLYDVFFINDSIGWAVGDKDTIGWILYSDDSGTHWNKQMNVIGVTSILYSVHFRNKDTGKICGQFGTFLHTNNGGIIGNGWALEISNPSKTKDLYSVYTFGLTGGCTVGADGTVLYTLDNFSNFITQKSNTTDTLNAVHGPPSSTSLWAVGNNGTIIFSQNYLLGWSKQNSGVTANLNDLYMVSNSNGWAVGDSGTILHFSPLTGSHVEYWNPKVMVYPNPAHDQLAIELDGGATDITVQLIDLTGQTVFKNQMEATKKMKLDVSSLTPGVYFLNLRSQKGSKMKKVVLY